MSTLYHPNDRTGSQCPYHVPTCSGDCQVILIEAEMRKSRTSPDQPAYRHSPFAFSQVNDAIAISRSLSHPPPSDQAPIISTTSSRHRMQRAFRQLYFPAGENDKDFIVTQLFDSEFLQAADPVLGSAASALCLFQLGVGHANLQLCHTAQEQYHLANRRLSAALRSPDSMHNDQIMASVYILGFCDHAFSSSASREVTSTTPANSERSTLERFKILQDLLSRFGLDNGNLPSPFTQLLVYNVCHVLGLRGCCIRKNVASAVPVWQACAAVGEPFMSILSEHVLALPLLLEETDQVLIGDSEDDWSKERGRLSDESSSLGSLRAVSLLQKLVEFENSLQRWLLEWYQSFAGAPYRTVNLTNERQLDHFTKYCESASHLQPDDGSSAAQSRFDIASNMPLAKALVFPSFPRGSAHTIYWSLLLLTKHAIVEVNRVLRHTARVESDDPSNRSDPSSWSIPRAEATLVQDATEYASNLAECLPWLTMPRFGLAGGLEARFVLCVLQRWFHWCEAEAPFEHGKGRVPGGGGGSGSSDDSRLDDDDDGDDTSGVADSVEVNEPRFRAQRWARWCRGMAKVIERKDPMTRIWTL